MAVYFIISYDVVDPENFPKYVEAVMPTLEKFGAEVLVADPSAKAIEGTAKNMNVLLRFKDEATAMNWYNSEDYAPVKKIRLNTTQNGTVVMAKEISGE